MRLDASPAELRRLRELLLELGDAHPASFAALFDPLAARCPVELPPASAELLRRERFVDGPDESLSGLHRVRRRGDRLYVLELGDGGAEYFQDVWPETDALLEALSELPAGRLLDVGTGSGIVALEGVAHGHAVVATDLYPSALALAGWNAALNGLTLETRIGHLFSPVAGERFDAILTAPHYAGTFAQLRLEVLRDGPAHLAAGGSLVLATVLEAWAGGAPSVVPSLLAELAQRHAVSLEPIDAPLKRAWFHLARGEAPSRQRYRITIREGGAGLRVAPPPLVAAVRDYVPLARLRAGATALLDTPDDLAALGAILDGLAAGALSLPAAPRALLDGCRFGPRLCVDGPRGAAGALLDDHGTVRPCARGPAVATALDDHAALEGELERLFAAAAERRGCAACPARSVCSRCLAPHLLDEAAYCDLIRARAAVLPRLHRLLRLLDALALLAPPGALELRLLPAAAPPAAREDPLLSAIRERCRARDAWVLLEPAPLLATEGAGRQELEPLPLDLAQVAGAIVAGADRRAVEGLVFPPRRAQRALEQLARRL